MAIRSIFYSCFLKYIYIYILSSTDWSVSFYQNSSVWLDRQDSRSWDRNPVDSKGPITANICVYIYIYTYIDSDGSFHIPEDCQHDLLYWLRYLEPFFFYSIFSGLSFPLRLRVASLCFNPFVQTFVLLKHTSLYTSHVVL